MKKIHAFLAERKDEAFSAAEVKEQFGLKRLSSVAKPDLIRQWEKYREDDRAIDIALEKLAQQRATEERIISGISYYLYRGPLVLDDTEEKFPS